MVRRLVTILVFVLSFSVTAMLHQAVLAQSLVGQPPASEVTPDPWPKVVDQNGVKYALYQP